MTNNLIFNNGSSFPICSENPINSLRMISDGWRKWNVTASCADVIEAVVSGTSHREYESITGVDDNGNAITEVLREELSDYVVPGSVCDNMDGTCTIFVRKRSELECERTVRQLYAESLDALGVDTANATESTEARLADIHALSGSADMTGQNEAIVDMSPAYCTKWVPGMELKAGRLVLYNDVKYLILQVGTAQEHYPPNMPNGAMLAVYKPYQGRYGYDWLYGEYIEVGFTRYENGVLYRAYQNPNANIYPPSQVPACWEVV